MDRWMDGWMDGWVDGWMDGDGLLMLVLMIVLNAFNKVCSNR